MFQTKVPALVTIEIKSVDVQVIQRCNLKVTWKRGPQVDESAAFEVAPDETEYFIPHTFKRASTLFRDKQGGLQKKDSQLNISNDGAIIGTAEVELGSHLGKTAEVTKFVLSADATITCAITVKELSKEEFEKASKG